MDTSSEFPLMCLSIYCAKVNRRTDCAARFFVFRLDKNEHLFYNKDERTVKI